VLTPKKIRNKTILRIEEIKVMSLFQRNSGGELAKAHQQNIMESLRHRIEAAKAQGDESLIKQLEQEMQQSTGAVGPSQIKAQPQRPAKEVAKMHQQNLVTNVQHRLEIARAQGDQTLVKQLEQEMQQLT
jgi:hypothetical protein